MSDTKSKPRLGRGLSSLISISSPPDIQSTPVAAAPVAEVQELPDVIGRAGEIPVGQIVPNPHQPRKMINHAAIAELAASLKSTGVIQPIVVRRVAQGYE